MIHYTLLPEEEMKLLRKEYRIRLSIILLFFVSCAIVVGILALLPSYILSHAQYSQAMQEKTDLEKSRKASGADIVEKDVMQSQAIAKATLADKIEVFYSDIIQDIISHRLSGIFVNSFEISHAVAESTSTPVTAVVQGKASNREILVAFKSALEKDKNFSKVELPVSDLAKSKDVSFALRLTLATKK